MKLKEIESALQQVPNFTKPIITLEQYTTPAKLGSLVLHYMDLNGDIQGLELADLGCGCGIFTLGCYLLGSRKVLAVDIDQDALELCESSLEKVTLINADVLTLLGDVKYESCVDVVVMNPPFGTKNNRGLDMKFLRVAAFMARKKVYSMHKSSTRQYVARTAQRSWGLHPKLVADCVKFNLPATYKCHQKKSVDVTVDLFCFECGQKEVRNLLASYT